MLEAWGKGFDEEGVETRSHWYYVSRERSDNNTQIFGTFGKYQQTSYWETIFAIDAVLAVNAEVVTH